MKLSSKLNKSIIILLSIVIFVSVITSTLLFNNSLASFVEKERQQLFQQISMDLLNLSQSEQGLNPAILQNYANNQKLMIQYFSNDNMLVSTFDGLSPDMLASNSDLVNIKIDLVNSFDEPHGYLLIQYLDDVFTYDESIKNFQGEIIRNYSIIFLGSILLGSVFVIIFSKRITDPIDDLKKATNNIRNRNYDLNQVKYNIYELDELSEDINYLAKTLSHQNQLRVDYAHDIAHELRTPITNLMLHLEGIQDQVIEADSQTISLLHSETVRLSKMIDSLETSFNDSDKIIEVNLEAVNLEELIENVANSFLPLIKDKNIEINQYIHEQIVIKTDKDKLTQILSNIISNAIKAIDINSQGQISIDAKSYNDRHVIIIQDNGIGMEEKDIEHIFDRFYRVDSVRNTKVSGHGLGLAITKNFVDLLGYKIKVNSKPGIGSEFIITIPK